MAVTKGQGSGTREGVGPAVRTSEAPAPNWLRAIIDAIGDDALTVSEIETIVGERNPTPSKAPIRDYIGVLLRDKLVRESHEDQHYELTDSGMTVRKGLVREHV